MVVTSNPLPGDHAFTIPFGTRARDPRDPWDLNRVVGQSGQGALRTPVPSESQLFTFATHRVRLASDADASEASLVLRVIANRVVSLRVLFAVLAGGLALLGGFLLIRCIRPFDVWAVSGLGLIAFEILSIRLLLALRYALDPSHLDSLATKGIAESAAALCFIPGVIFLGAALQVLPSRQPAPGASLDALRWKTLRNIGAYILLIAALAFYGFRLPTALWPDLPERLIPGLAGRMGAFIVLASAFLFMHALGQVAKSKSRSTYFDWVFRIPVLMVKNSLLGARERWGRHSLPALMWVSLASLFGVVCFFSAGRLKILEELVIPLFWIWPAAFTWLGVLKASEVPSIGKVPLSTHIRWLAWWGFARFMIPAMVVPFFIRDIGSLYATISIFGSLVLLLFALRRFNRHTITAFAYLMLILIGGGVFFVKALDDYSLLRGTRFAAARVLTWKEGQIAEKRLLEAGVDKNSVLQEDSLRNALEHSWENLAMAHEGGSEGKGFGEAPAHASHVPQATLQYDSVFSFFILGDFGRNGGLSLLLIFAMPVVLFLASGRRRFDLGHAVGVLLALNMLIQAFLQAAMNLGLLPFTGRNIPWLAVNSFSNLLLWTIIFFLMAQAMTWRISPLKSDAEEDSFDPAWPDLVDGPSARSRGDGRRALHYLLLAGAILLPVLWLFPITKRARDVAKDDNVRTFDLNPMLQELEGLIKQNVLVLMKPGTEGESFRIEMGKEHLEHWNSYSRLRQEIAYFNALPRGEQAEGSRIHEDLVLLGPEGKEITLGAWASSIKIPQEYHALLKALRDHDPAAAPRHHVPLFHVKSKHVEDEDDGQPELAVNPVAGYKTRLSSEERDPGSMLKISLFIRNQGPLTPKQEIIWAGPAWVRGRWVPRTNAEIPWIDDLAIALGKRSSEEFLGNAKTVHLTLDPNLQGRTQSFVADKGRRLHEEILADPVIQQEVRKGERPLALIRPRRVALTVISIPDGKVLSLGAWPRPASGRIWKQAGEEWMPSQQWTRTKAPASFRTAYDQDHNLSTSVAMGSATKPMWATIALRIHPELDTRFQVQGGAEVEHDVFGIPIRKPWAGDHIPGVVDFPTYLQKSSNRFQVRMGFLSLAERDGNQVSFQYGGLSSHEILYGRTGLIPGFPEWMAFGLSHPDRLNSLHKSRMAEMFQSTFGIGVESLPRRAEELTSTHESDGSERPSSGSGLTSLHSSRKLSFWTGQEADDLLGVTRLKYLREIAPEATNFELDLISSDTPRIVPGEGTGPREFINLLLGSKKNRWSNVEFASAFGTAITGTPIVPHLIDDVSAVTDRKPFPVSSRLLQGLAEVLAPGGTAYNSFSLEARKALAELRAMGIEAYAKTGTLWESDEPGQEGRKRQTSRIVIALVRGNGGVRGKGLVISILAERAAIRSGLTSEWLGQFLSENLNEIKVCLGLPQSSVPIADKKQPPPWKQEKGRIKPFRPIRKRGRK